MDTISEMMDVIRAARTLLVMSQEELAQRSGVSRATIQRIETGDEGTAWKQIEKVRLALEDSGIEFLPSAPGRGPAVAIKRGVKITSSRIEHELASNHLGLEPSSRHRLLGGSYHCDVIAVSCWIPFRPGIYDRR